MAKHTPGPWRYLPDPTTGDWIVSESLRGEDGRNLVIAQATLHEASGGRMHIDHDDLEANAHLIAAAPDMLALLKRLYEWGHLDTAGDGPYWRTELDLMIADAEGRE